MELYLKLFEVLFPVFFVVGIGYYLGKNNPKIDTTFITNFAANIGTPAMIIYALTSTGISFEIFKDYFWYFLIAIVAFTFIGIVFLFFLKTKDIIRELPPFIMPNTGNMGLPICLFAYGSQGLGVAAAISALIILCHFTLGIFLADRKFNINVILKNPPFYAIIISVIFLYFKIELPVFVENTTFLLMYATIFLILMSLGIALTRFKVFSFNRYKSRLQLNNRRRYLKLFFSGTVTALVPIGGAARVWSIGRGLILSRVILASVNNGPFQPQWIVAL
jgi:predicted permease